MPIAVLINENDAQFPIETVINTQRRQFTLAAAIELRDKLTAAINELAEAVETKQIQDCCDHDWDDIGNGKEQCTYLECQKIRDAD